MKYIAPFLFCVIDALVISLGIYFMHFNFMTDSFANIWLSMVCFLTIFYYGNDSD